MSVAYIPDQQSLADELDRWTRDDRCRYSIRSRIQCRQCGEELGRLVDVALDLDQPGRLSEAPFAPVLSVKVYGRARADRIRAARASRDGTAPDGKRYPFDDYVVAFPNDPRCPATLPLHCTAHGDRIVCIGEVLENRRVRV